MAAKTIILKGEGVRREALCSAIVKPGYLVEIESTGKVKPHATAAGVAAAMFAVEDDLQGNGIDTDYASGKLVQYNVMRPGDEVWALIKDGEAIAIGDKLVSGGDGTLKELGTEAQQDAFLAIALEAKDMSDSSAADPASARCKVMIV
jgi:hypothetical protein